MKNKLMFIGLSICAAGLNASEGVKTMEAAQDFVAPSRYAQFLTSTKNTFSNAATRAQTFGSDSVNYLGETRAVKFVAPYATATKTKVASVASSVANTASNVGSTVANAATTAATSVKTNAVKAWNAEIYGYKNGGKVAISTAAVVATVGLTYAAYKKGLFARLNPFGKATVVQTPVTQEVPAVETSAPEISVAQEVTIEQTPVVAEQTSVEQTPVVAQAPVVAAPVAGSVVKAKPMVRKYRTN
ncbi:MAG TPA: hypothetical protein VLG50_02235 [Candidatus Saccharimonadales bacterium]|nr:hypothetical protein [Candidatus Saccharimonadales bacterium]